MQTVGVHDQQHALHLKASIPNLRQLPLHPRPPLNQSIQDSLQMSSLDSFRKDGTSGSKVQSDETAAPGKHQERGPLDGQATRGGSEGSQAIPRFHMEEKLPLASLPPGHKDEVETANQKSLEVKRTAAKELAAGLHIFYYGWYGTPEIDGKWLLQNMTWAQKLHFFVIKL